VPELAENIVTRAATSQEGQGSTPVSRQCEPMQSTNRQALSRLSVPSGRTELPHSVEAEMGVLGSMASDPRKYIPVAQQSVGPEHFSVPRHVTVFNALVSMFENEGAFDLVTFTQHMTDTGQINSVGGPAFVTDVFTFVPTGALIDHYLDIVRDKYVSRKIIEACNESVRAAYEEQGDLTEMVAEHERRMELVRVASQVGHLRLPNLADMSKLIGANRPEKPPELVQGILHQGSKLIVGGTSKGRKTMALIDLAVSVATGTPWWGIPCKQAPVCYSNFEIQEAFFCERAHVVCCAKGVQLPPAMFMGWNLRGHGEGIENLVDDLMAVLRHRMNGLIVFDPIYKGLGDRDENKAGDVASMMNQLEKIAVKTQAAIAFGAHYSKGNQSLKESIDRIGGSGVFARDPDSILTMTAHEKEEAFTVDATLRNFAPIKPFVVKWAWPLFTRAEGLDPENLKKPKTKVGRPADAEDNAEELLELLDVGLRYGEFQRAAEQRLQIKEKTFEKYFSILKRANRIMKIAGMWTRNDTL
jgi:hypothetical protein